MQCVVYDLEATCWDGEPYAEQSEIIEIAAYKINRYGEVEGPFQSFVRPILFPKLSPYCRELTSINQSDIDEAGEFAEILEDFLDWIGEYPSETVFCAWGKFDPIMFRRDCALHKYPDDWLVNVFDVKEEYRILRGRDKPLGLLRSCEDEEITFTGTPHRAIWDSYNLLNLFMKYYKYWDLPI